MNSWIVGSAGECDVVIDHVLVSGRHCRLERTESGLWIEDLHSTNGTYVNGRRIQEPTPLTVSDQVTLGTKVPFRWPEELKPATRESCGPNPAARLPRSWQMGLLVTATVVLSVIAGTTGVWTTAPRSSESSFSAEAPGPSPPNPSPTEAVPSNRSNFEPTPVAEVGKTGTLRLDETHDEDVVKSIKVRIALGPGEDLGESLDLHLGLGFPLRLTTTVDSRASSFAAYPQVLRVDGKQLANGEQPILPAEGVAEFEFLAQSADPGRDPLLRTPALLDGVRGRDICQIGFACRGESQWTLASYEIRVNDRLFAAHDGVQFAPRRKQIENSKRLRSVLRTMENAAKRVGEPSGKSDAASQSARQSLEEQDEEVRRLSRILKGEYPCFIETDPRLDARVRRTAGSPAVRQVTVGLLTSTDPQSGTAHDLYLRAGASKFLLTSSSDPLRESAELQTLTLPSDVLRFDPLSLTQLSAANLGIGLLGGDSRTSVVPDRAKLQRVTVSANGRVVFDSESRQSDRQSLAQTWLVPPGHRDPSGFPVNTPETPPYERHLWRPGQSVPSPTVAGPPPPTRPREEPGRPSSSFPAAIPVVSLPAPAAVGTSAAASSGVAPEPPPIWVLLPPDTRRREPVENFVLNQINVLLINPPAAAATPGPAAAVVNSVHIDLSSTGSGPLVRFGDPVTVTWTLDDPAGQVNRFRVSLRPVLPHRTDVFLTAVASEVVAGGATRRAVLTPQERGLADGQPAVSRVEQPYLFLQPAVVGLDENGEALAGVAATGPIVPVFPAGAQPGPLTWTSPAPGSSQSFVPQGGLAWPDSPAFPLPSPPPPPRFALASGAWLFGPAQLVGVGWPTSGTAVSRDLATNRQCQGRVTDASPDVGAWRAWAQQGLVRSANGVDEVAFQMMASNVSTPNRFIAHFGVVDSMGATDGAMVQADVRVFGAASPFALERWVATAGPVSISPSREQWTLLDLPIIGPGGVSPGPVSTPNEPWSPPVQLLFRDTPPTYGPMSLGGNRTVCVTIRVRSPANATVGVFGARLVRD